MIKFKKIEVGLAVVGIAMILSAPAIARVSDDEFDQIVDSEISDDGKIKKLNSQIEEKADEVRDLEEREDIYEQNIRAKQDEQLTLKSQISQLDDQIDQTKVDIERKEIELDILQLEIEILKDQILIAENDEAREEAYLKEVIFDIYEADQTTPVEITFGNSTFSDFYNDYAYTNSVQTNLQEILERVQFVRDGLEDQRSEVKDKKSEISVQKQDLEIDQQNLEGEEAFKNNLLSETEESEEKFQSLLENVRGEKQTIDGTISALEKNVQDKILNIRNEVTERLQDDNEENDTVTEEEQQALDGVTTFSWPIDSRTVTCGFRCENYPFKRWFEHSGIDIATPMGSQVRAAAAGYVAIAKFDGSSNYAYIMVVHGNGLATVYAHVSCVSVSVDQYVRKGQQIGCSGGMPGAPGSGAYSTGAHLHFEVRLDGIPINPMNYIP